MAWPIWAKILSAFIGTPSDLINAYSQYKTNEQNMEMMRENNAFNSAEAAKARDFELQMSNTAYQRSMADMEQAGLNPILAYQQGGASTVSAEAAHSASTAHLDAPKLATNVANSVMTAVVLGKALGSKGMNKIGFGR